MSKLWKPWILALVLLLLGAHLNLAALVPLQVGDSPPPWWVGGRLIWPFAEETNSFLPDDLLNASTPILAITSAFFFLLAAVALLRWRVPSQWFPWLVVAGVACSVTLQIIWFSGWAIFPLFVDVVLLWAIIQMSVTVKSLRAN